MINPTQEQQSIKAIARHGGSMVVNAFAGTGKTTTLALIAENHPARHVMYLAFNRSIAQEAKARMPNKVHSMTFHSLAYKAMRPDRSRLEARLNGRFIADYFGLPRTDLKACTYALDILRNYCNIPEPELLFENIPPYELEMVMAPNKEAREKAQLEAVRIKARGFEIAKMVWREQCDPASNLPITHDTYVKQWSFLNPKINTDLILFDEAQDASPIFVDIVEKQDCDVVWVGDRHQQIYEWRGAVDALDYVYADHHAYLTESFRFGDEIAGRATKILSMLGENRPLIGRGSSVDDGQTAILARTNATAIAEYIKAKEENPAKRVAMVGADNFVRLLQDAKNLREGFPSGQFVLFKDWNELVEYSETDDGQDVTVLIGLISEYEVEPLIFMLNASEENLDADIVISTIHRAKGLEWSRVRVCGDWPTNDGDPVDLLPDELRLLYVAITRAKCYLDARALHRWLPGIFNEEDQGLPPLPQSPSRPLPDEGIQADNVIVIGGNDVDDDGLVNVPVRPRRQRDESYMQPPEMKQITLSSHTIEKLEALHRSLGGRSLDDSINKLIQHFSNTIK